MPEVFLVQGVPVKYSDVIAFLERNGVHVEDGTDGYVV